MNNEYREKAIEILKNKTALVFCGGGVLGIAECGALFALEEIGLKMKNIKSVSGSSSGSILAAVIATGYIDATKYMKEMLDNTDFTKFKDNDCFIKSAYQFLTKYGINKTTEINNIGAKILQELTKNSDITFKELYDKTGITLTITYVSINHDGTVYANHITEPTSSIRNTLVKSSTIPVYYEANIEGKGITKQISIDGGVLDNYPMGVPRKQGINPDNILGLRLISSGEETNTDLEQELVDSGPPANAIQYFVRIINILRNQALKIHVSKNDWMLSIKIDCGKLSATDFNITKEQKEWLFNQGKIAVYNYIDELAGLLEKDKYPYL